MCYHARLFRALGSGQPTQSLLTGGERDRCRIESILALLYLCMGSIVQLFPEPRNDLSTLPYRKVVIYKTALAYVCSAWRASFRNVGFLTSPSMRRDQKAAVSLGRLPWAATYRHTHTYTRAHPHPHTHITTCNTQSHLPPFLSSPVCAAIKHK